MSEYFSGEASLIHKNRINRDAIDSSQGVITVDQLPSLTLPLLDLIEQTRPHVAVAFDRNARLFGLATHVTWRQTRPSQPFPTLDGRIHFCRPSKTEDQQTLLQRFDTIIATTIKHGEHRGNLLSEQERLRILCMDDWVMQGGTKQFVHRLGERYDAQMFFAVMRGTGADISAQPDNGLFVASWGDKPKEIGIDYAANANNGALGMQQVVPAMTPQAQTNRERIFTAAQALTS